MCCIGIGTDSLKLGNPSQANPAQIRQSPHNMNYPGLAWIGVDWLIGGENIARVQNWVWNCPDITIVNSLLAFVSYVFLSFLSFCLFVFLSFCLFVFLSFWSNVSGFFNLKSHYLQSQPSSKQTHTHWPELGVIQPGQPKSGLHYSLVDIISAVWSIYVGCMWNVHFSWCGIHVGFLRRWKHSTLHLKIQDSRLWMWDECGLSEESEFPIYFLVQKS